MPIPDKTPTQSQDILIAFNFRETFEQSHLQKFLYLQKEKLTHLKVVLANSDLCVSPDVANALFPMHKAVHQKVYVSYTKPINPGVGNQLKLIGEGGYDTDKHELQPLPMIVEDFGLSRIQEHMQELTGIDNVDEKYRLAFEKTMAEKLHSLATRSSKQLAGFIDANKATAGGVGTIYSNSVADHKVIPAGEDKTLFAALETEAGENKITELGMPDVIGSSFMNFLLRVDQSYGANNNQNKQVFHQWYNNIHIDHDLAVIDPATDSALIEVIARGGIFAKSFVHNTFGNQRLDIAGHTWEKFMMPRLPFLEGIDASKIQVGFKGFKGPVDNYATMPYEEARIDIQSGGVLWTQWYPAIPPEGNTILAYRKTK